MGRTSHKTRAVCFIEYLDRSLSGTWAPFFHNVADFIGMENYFVKMYTDPDIVDAITEHIVDFYVGANEKIFTTANGAIDIHFLGDDFGSQNGLLISPKMFRRFILPHIRRFVEGIKKFGVKTMIYSCGAVSEIIPDCIDIGIDGLHPVQVEARDMIPENLAAMFDEATR